MPGKLEMHLVYLDCSAGIAGDMLLAALIDLGAPLEQIRGGLDKLPLTESWSLEIETVTRRGISARRAVVTIAGKPADAAFQEGAEEHHHGHAHAPARPYAEIKRMLEHADLSPRALSRAGRVFLELAKAEGAVHGIPYEEVHFHEVGSTDAIIDVVGVCLALELLEIDALEASPLHLGHGFVKAAHGRLPVPAPATLQLLQGFPVYQTDIAGELVTPTGAALVRGLCRRVGPMPLLTIERIGHGAGTRDPELPNILRAILAHEGARGFERDEVMELSANIDDMNPQLFGALYDTLLEAGALDVWVETATMKKGRPGHVLHALARLGAEADLGAVMLRETTSLGVRAKRMSRLMLAREWREVMTSGGPVRVKLGRKGQEVWNIAPEYEDCLKAAAASGRPLKRILEEAKAAALEVGRGSD